MDPSSSPPCPRCGAPILAGATDSLCPACLLSGALGTPDNEAASTAQGPSAAPREFTDFPCRFGGYSLLGVLGTGGMGTVYEAEHLATGRRVALKMLEQELDSPEMRQRFLREGRLAASVNHPNSLYIFGSEEIEGTPVITMEIAAGGTLKDKLKGRGPLPVAEAVDAILGVISGLEAAFAVGVLHRDVKPSNCFVSPDGSVKVGDFGLSVSTLARDDSYATATGVVMGTPAFAPPEQLRGDDLDVRADIYSVGATLFTLLTGKAPFEGRNAVQVVANAVNQKPRPVSELCQDVPPALERVVARCLAKEPEGRYADYMALRNALLPFGSDEPEPASMQIRASAGWIDYLIAFLVPYVPLMLLVGNDEFHLRLYMDRTLFAARHYLAFVGFGLLYFSLAEGIWGAGLGKRLKGLRVVRPNGQPPGIGRALIRILMPVLSIELVRVPLLLASISATRIDDLSVSEIVIFSTATTLCPWIAVLLSLRARRANGFATLWDLASGTRVVVKPKGALRPSVGPAAEPTPSTRGGQSLGPYEIVEELAPGEWLVATDPVLRRRVWLLRRKSAELSGSRRDLARSGRLRWLQKVETDGAVWDAFEATPGQPFTNLVEGGQRVPWGTLRYWLHDLATELWASSGEETLPAELSLDHVWITAQGRAVLLDEPWPAARLRAERIAVGSVSGQQRFLNAVVACVEPPSVPLHAKPLLNNLGKGKFEKLSFLTGSLRGILNRPSEVSRGIRAGSMFMLPAYAWIMLFVGSYRGADWLYERIGDSDRWIAMITLLVVLSISAVFQLLEVPLRTTASHSLFRLAVVDAHGGPARMGQLLVRWGILWVPLLAVMWLAVSRIHTAEGVAFWAALGPLLLWIGAAAYAVAHPNRGLHDRLAGTWVVRR